MKIARLLLVAAVVMAPACHKTEDNPVTLANQILDLTDSHAQMQQAFEAGLKPSLDRLKAQGIPADITDKIHTDSMKFFDDNFKWDEVKPQIADLYAKAYTAEELRDIIAFYQTPTGKKVVEKMPSLMQQAMTVAMGRVQKSMPEFQRKVGTMIMDYRRKQMAAHPPSPGQRPPGRAFPPNFLVPQKGGPVPPPGTGPLAHPVPVPAPQPAQAPTPTPAAAQAPVPLPSTPSGSK